MVHTFSTHTLTDPASLPSGACMSLKARALKPGHAKVTITYTHQDILLEASVTIAAYPPLMPVDPEHIAVVTLGSSKDFVFKGGPAAWVLDRSKYFDKCECCLCLCLYQT